MNEASPDEALEVIADNDSFISMWRRLMIAIAIGVGLQLLLFFFGLYFSSWVSHLAGALSLKIASVTGNWNSEGIQDRTRFLESAVTGIYFTSGLAAGILAFPWTRFRLRLIAGLSLLILGMLFGFYIA